jgi:hypothetical protein
LDFHGAGCPSGGAILDFGLLKSLSFTWPDKRAALIQNPKSKIQNRAAFTIRDGCAILANTRL